MSWYLDDESLFNTNRIEVDPKYDGSYQFSLDTHNDYALFTKIYEKFDPLGKICVEELKDYLKEIGSSTISLEPGQSKLARTSINTAVKA